MKEEEEGDVTSSVFLFWGGGLLSSRGRNWEG